MDAAGFRCAIRRRALRKQTVSSAGSEKPSRSLKTQILVEDHAPDGRAMILHFHEEFMQSAPDHLVHVLWRKTVASSALASAIGPGGGFARPRCRFLDPRQRHFHPIQSKIAPSAEILDRKAETPQPDPPQSGCRTPADTPPKPTRCAIPPPTASDRSVRPRPPFAAAGNDTSGRPAVTRFPPAPASSRRSEIKLDIARQGAMADPGQAMEPVAKVGEEVVNAETCRRPPATIPARRGKAC